MGKSGRHKQFCSPTNVFDQAEGLCSYSEPNEDTTKVQNLIREPGGGLLLAPNYST